MFNLFIPDTTPAAYNNYGNPPTVNVSVNNVTIGPIALNDASEGLNNKFWATYYDPITDNIILDDLAGTTEVITNEPLGVTRIGLAFDQNGNDVYAWITETDILMLRFFDSGIPGDTIVNLGAAQDVVITMDMKYQPSNARSDVLLFYIRNGGIFYRVQRESYAIENPTPVIAGASRLIDSGMRTDYRFQVKWY
ncbi:MAG: hypothetical protein MJK15_03175 [Colwellia sp.]|nr:hypothetical protein [Colwellia sp.]